MHGKLAIGMVVVLGGLAGLVATGTRASGGSGASGVSGGSGVSGASGGSGGISGSRASRARDSSESGLRGTNGILIELFTSQGCSSCPPADRLLTELGRHDDLIPLSFHVDYWNYIGWTDPFSSKLWSERQRAYARRFGSNRIYTPQVVIDGRSETVGSNRPRVEELLARAARRPGRAKLDLLAASAAGELVVRVGWTAASVPERGALELFLAVAERDLVTAVGRGENARKTLRNDHVVRHLERVGGQIGASGERSARIALDPSWRRDGLTLVAFLAEADSLEVSGAAKLEVPPVAASGSERR